MIRLDKFLAELNKGSRSQVKELIKKGYVTVNGGMVKSPEMKINEKADKICVQGELCVYEKFVYYMLHKPAGVVSATEDKKEKTVLELLEGETVKNIFPVGRLDKDTEGLLLLTNDGVLAHELLAPGKHVEKTYLVKTRDVVTEDAREQLRAGVHIGEKEKTKPAKVEEGVEKREILLTITEGKFHQIKRMMKAVNHEVVYLKRLRMGTLLLDEALKKGAYRKLTEYEIQQLTAGISRS